MSIKTEIDRINSAKDDIKEAIEEKGVSVPANATIDNYSTYIQMINNMSEVEVKALIAAALANYLPKTGGTLTGDLIFSAGSANSSRFGIKWAKINGHTPYMGYDRTTQVDGTFVIMDMTGDGDYKQGLAVGGGSGNLLWKGAKVATTSDIPKVETSLTETSSTAVPSSKAVVTYVDKSVQAVTINSITVTKVS